MRIINSTIATMPDRGGYGLLTNAAIIIDKGIISWVGAMADMPPVSGKEKEEVMDCGHRLITPALIDCHTHIVHAGTRVGEFEMRQSGESYEEIARQGGGILATVAATRASSEDALLATSLPRVDALIAEGVVLLEIKSGYGLSIDHELAMLRVARQIGEVRPLRVKTAFLAAHAIPPEYADRGKGSDAYIDEVCLPALTQAHAEGLVDAVDGFCEGIAFTPAQIARLFDKAHVLGLPVKLHADQLSSCGGTALAAKYSALSADHLEYASPADAAALAKAGTVAVLLPGAFYTLGATHPPPIVAFRKENVPMAVATDLNPGSSPMYSLLLAMNMACTLFGLTPQEALAGVTNHAAQALGVSDSGRIKAGMRGDLAVWDVDHPSELSYRFGFNPLYRRIFDGRVSP